MQGREIFAALLRVLGIWFLYSAVYDAIFLGLRLMGVMPNLGGQVSGEKILIGLHLFMAFILLAGADKIVALLYGRQPA